MDTRARLWAAINSHVVNCGGNPGLKPHELVHGEEWGREHIEVIEGLIRDLAAQRKSAKVWKQKYNELMRMQETYIKRLHALEAEEKKE
jgi:hypothetical protein